MATTVGDLTKLGLNPGNIYWAPLGTAITDPTPVASKLPVLGAPWVALGYTDEGFSWSYAIGTENVEVAELLDPAAVITTSRTITATFSLAQINNANLKYALNGGTITATGTGATALSKLEAPALGAEVRAMIAWQSTDDTERLILKQVLQSGEVSIARRKGAAKALIPFTMTAEAPADGSSPFVSYTSGARG